MIDIPPVRAPGRRAASSFETAWQRDFETAFERPFERPWPGRRMFPPKFISRYISATQCFSWVHRPRRARIREAWAEEAPQRTSRAAASQHRVTRQDEPRRRSDNYQVSTNIVQRRRNTVFAAHQVVKHRGVNCPRQTRQKFPLLRSNIRVQPGNDRMTDLRRLDHRALEQIR